MEIAALKQQLDIYVVAERLGMKIDKYHRAHCPFHDDKRPSLQFSKEKQIATCFSGNCDAGTMDVITLTEKTLQVTTHQAIKWLEQEFLGIPDALIKKRETSPEELPNYTKLFKAFEANLKKSTKGKDYLASRGLAQLVGGSPVGYNASTWSSMRNCVIFPLRDRERKIVSFYGRAITKGHSMRHYYNKNRKGLYPCYPSSETEVLVLTESVIDAATLGLHTDYTVLALYGTNGLTEEHSQAMKSLSELKEVILFLDGDEAGRAASAKYGKELSALLSIKVSQVETPEGADINSLVQSHEPEILQHLINERVSLSPEEKQAVTPAFEVGKLIADNPELLLFEFGALQVLVLGGIKISGLDRLRVTLKLSHQAKPFLLPLRHNLDLYHNGQVEQLTQKVADHLEVSTQQSVLALAQLTNALEKYRNERLEALKPKRPTVPELSISERAAAEELLQSPELIKRTMQLITQSGIIGEERNALIAYLTYTSRKRSNPLHLMCLGASGIGKTHLQEKIGELIPEEDKLEITTLSENAFYYFGKEELKHKLLLIEDLDGAESVLYPLRELQSKRRISKTVTLKDSKGNLKTVTLKVEGPVCVSGCTTREKLYEDNANRCILIYIDSSSEQDEKIMAYQRNASAGAVNKQAEGLAQRQLQNIQRLLRPVAVRNPYANQIQLPESVFKPRRTMVLLLSFIETITYYHQAQRERKTDAVTHEEYIETSVDDVALGFRLLKEVLFSKSDELSGACRKFFEGLKTKLERGSSFTQKQIRSSCRVNPYTLKRYLRDLLAYGRIKIVGGNKHRGYEYSLVDVEEYDRLRDSIDSQLQAVLSSLKSR